MPRTSQGTDVLDVLASISNKEVFTPPSSAAAMLSLLPETYWTDPDILWIDPVSKTGVFPREIYSRLMEGLASKFESEAECRDHILSKMLLVIGTSRLGALAARRTLFGASEFSKSPAKSNPHLHDFVFAPSDGLSAEQICLAFESRTGKEFANEEDEKNNNKRSLDAMFEIIERKRGGKPSKVIVVGNPPYQENDGGGAGGSSAKPIYNIFFEAAKKISSEVLFVIPARWFAGGKGLSEFRAAMLKKPGVARIVDFYDSKDVFPANEIEGGVCFVLWKKGYEGDCEFSRKDGIKVFRKLSEHDIFVRDTESLSIIASITKHKNFSPLPVAARNPYDITSKYTGFVPAGAGTIECLTSTGTKHVKRSAIADPVAAKTIDKWKVVCSKADGAGNKINADGKRRVLSKILVLPPGSVCSETYLLVSTFDTDDEAKSCASYMKTKLPRHMLGLRKISQNMSQNTFAWVSKVPFNKTWTDDAVYQHFGLSDEQRRTIDGSIAELSK